MIEQHIGKVNMNTPIEFFFFFYTLELKQSWENIRKSGFASTYEAQSNCYWDKIEPISNLGIFTACAFISFLKNLVHSLLI